MNRYTVFVIPVAWQEIKELPGHMRQRVRRAIDALAANPRSAKSKQLDVPNLKPELYRLRLDRWRIIYAATETDRFVDILAVRKRPPYDYDDLEDLITELL